MICEFQIRAECIALDTNYYRDGCVVIDTSDIKTLIPYLYEKHFGKKYNELSWYLEEGAREFVKDIEDKWMHNQLEVEEDSEFLNKYFENHKDEIVEKYAEDIKDEITEELEALSDKELKELDDDYMGFISFDLYLDNEYVGDYDVDIPEYDDSELDWDDDDSDAPDDDWEDDEDYSEDDLDYEDNDLYE